MSSTEIQAYILESVRSKRADKVKDWYLFRGSSLVQGMETVYPGNHPDFEVTPVSTDPLVATLFATESSNYGPGIVMIFNVGALTDLGIQPGNMGSTLRKAESELSVGATPSTVASRAFITITVEKSRQILATMGYMLPGWVPRGKLTDKINAYPKLSGEQIQQFVRAAQE